MQSATATARGEVRPRVIVKFKDSIPELPYDNTADNSVRARFPGVFASEPFMGLRLTPLFDSVPAASIRRFQQHAQDIGVKDVPNFLNYFAASIPEGLTPTDVIEHLHRGSINSDLEVCYVEEAPRTRVDRFVSSAHHPQPIAGDYDPDVKDGLQRHLLSAPISVGAVDAWKIKGGDGAGMCFADLEVGWALGHDEFEGYDLSVLGTGVNMAFGFKHGTNVLGIVAGKRNGRLGQGIAYGLDSILLASPYRQFGHHNVAAPLMEILTAPKSPHVILLEVGNELANGGTGPIETIPCVRQQILAATGQGIVVIEPAGNAEDHAPLDIDTEIDNDSGATIVGAVTPLASHKRLASSNFGDRVDCYAWGDGIHTAVTDEHGTATTESGFGLGETSGAAAIIAGVALSIQGMLNAAGRPLLSPGEIRAILRDPKLGTACSPGGSMPDLKRIAQELGL
jgi:hypothetical protein